MSSIQFNSIACPGVLYQNQQLLMKELRSYKKFHCKVCNVYYQCGAALRAQISTVYITAYINYTHMHCEKLFCKLLEPNLIFTIYHPRKLDSKWFRDYVTKELVVLFVCYSENSIIMAIGRELYGGIQSDSSINLRNWDWLEKGINKMGEVA